MDLSDSIADLGPDFGNRFGELLKMAKAHERAKQAALVPAAGEKSLLTCEGFVGGTDVELVLVRAKKGDDGQPLAVRETLTYRGDVAGSDLVYDLTGEFMQGKARPFDCDLRTQPARLYSLLPFQVEHRFTADAQISNLSEPGKLDVRVEFVNGLGKPAAGTLPCHLELRTPDGKVAWERFLTTGADGRLSQTLDFPPSPQGKWQLVVRSLLTGEEITRCVPRPK